MVDEPHELESLQRGSARPSTVAVPECIAVAGNNLGHRRGKPVVGAAGALGDVANAMPIGKRVRRRPKEEGITLLGNQFAKHQFEERGLASSILSRENHGLTGGNGQ